MLPDSRLISQMQRTTSDYVYSDFGYLITNIGTGVFDEYNQETKTVSEVPLKCSFTDKIVSERWSNITDYQDFIAEVRFKGQQPNKGDSFKITKRYGNDVINQTYEVAGIKDRGLAGFVCALKAVTI